jgi:hypothetical protein
MSAATRKPIVRRRYPRGLALEAARLVDQSGRKGACLRLVRTASGTWAR